MVYLGIDLHRKHSVVAALTPEGGVLFSRRIESRPEAFQRIFGELERESLSVVFEATYGWYWLADPSPRRRAVTTHATCTTSTGLRASSLWKRR